MRKWAYLCLTLFAFVPLSVPCQGSAQSIFFGAGPNFPVDEFDYAKTGFLAVAGLELPAGVDVEIKV